MNIKSLIKRVLPARIFVAVRSVPYEIVDLLRAPPQGEIIPPLRLQLDGPRGYDIFRANGQEAFNFYVSEVGIKPDSTILDIGSGIGRKTLPLLKYLTSAGLYVGVDIDERGIKWCSRNITSVYPNFVFFTLDIFNKLCA